MSFNDGCEAIMWNANKYYSWLSEGHIIFPSGNCYKWHNGRPSVKIMFNVKQSLKQYNINDCRTAKSMVDELFYIQNS